MKGVYRNDKPEDTDVIIAKHYHPELGGLITTSITLEMFYKTAESYRKDRNSNKRISKLNNVERRLANDAIRNDRIIKNRETARISRKKREENHNQLKHITLARYEKDEHGNKKLTDIYRGDIPHSKVYEEQGYGTRTTKSVLKKILSAHEKYPSGVYLGRTKSNIKVPSNNAKATRGRRYVYVPAEPITLKAKIGIRTMANGIIKNIYKKLKLPAGIRLRKEIIVKDI